ncbi:MAG: capsule assembly Wzi family protein [Acidobacteriota bacterium]|nr:capsule assembly Wzi family protein [Acidobacteriota bacterium]
MFLILAALSLIQTPMLAQSGEPIPSHHEVAAASASTAGSSYISVDSWIYTAALRLYYLGYLPTAYIGVRPWTGASLAHMLVLSQDALQSTYAPAEAIEINARLRRELAPELAGGRSPSLRAASVYTRAREINGYILNDSFHFGQTIVNDYGRPDERGFNNVTGFSAEAQGGRFSLMVRAEYQHAPSAIGYSPSVAAQLASIDGTPDVPQTTIPAGFISGQDISRVVEASASVHVLGHEISFGKSDEWLGPALGASMAWSNNAENIYGFRINRVEPLYVPGLSRYVGLFRYDFVVGPLKGHEFPGDPWIHMEKISMKTTPDIEIGFMRAAIWGGHGQPCLQPDGTTIPCDVPITIGSFLRSFFSVTAAQPAVKFSRKNPGARFSTFDFTWRTPWDNHLVTLYLDSFAHDNVFPISNLGRSGVRPGFYLARLPGLPRVDFRAEGVTTNVHDPESTLGRLLLWETVQTQGYTNKGNILGDWIGREGTGGQAWLTWHLRPDQQIQLQYRRAKEANDFIPGGTTQNDLSADVVLRPLRNLEIKANIQGEFWKAPLIAQGQQNNVVGTIQLTYFLHKE